MTLDEARAHVGEKVIYSLRPGQADTGVISSVGDVYVFVLYGRDFTPKATYPGDLTLMRGGGVAEHFRLGMLDAGFPMAGEAGR